MTIALVVPAAGHGIRLAMNRPKALVDVDGRPLLRRTVDRFAGVSELVEVVVVAPRAFIGETEAALAGCAPPGWELRVVAGGATRQESVGRGLDAIHGVVELVCVHDAARPLVTAGTIERVLAAARESGAATAASRPVDSVREDVDGGSTRPLDRTRIWLVETPQAFRLDLLRAAHGRARETGLSATDDATLVEVALGQPVSMVESEAPNPKITHAEDLKLVRGRSSTGRH